MPGVTPNFSPYNPPNLPSTKIVALDVPPLSNTSLALGCYFVAGPYRTAGLGAWNGATVFRSPDGGVTWIGQAPAIGKQSAIGFATNALPNWGGKHSLDTASRVRVQLSNSALTLASCTMAQLLNGANTCFIGSELLQFLTASVVSTGVYDLTGLIRGLQGTGYAMSTHAIGDQFVLIDPEAVADIECLSSQLSLGQYYLGVTNGAPLAATWVPPTQFTFTGNRAKPLSVVQAGASKQTNNDIIIEWVRRARLNNEWRDYADVPLDETVESYRVDILNGSTVVRSITSSTPTVTYTSAQQTTDFGAPVSSLSANIYQLSSVVGDGWPNAFSWP